MLKAVCVTLAMLLPTAAVSDPVLLMAEEDGCLWCAKWDEEVSHIYPKTAEGRTAPLMRYDIHDEPPGFTFAKRVLFTPTFILMQDGQEVGRIEGYPGDVFFWGLLNEILTRAGIPLEQAG